MAKLKTNHSFLLKCSHIFFLYYPKENTINKIVMKLCRAIPMAATFSTFVPAVNTKLALNISSDFIMHLV